MRLLALLLLGLLVISLAALPCLAAPPDAAIPAMAAPDTAAGVPVVRVDQVDQKDPAGWFWSGGLVIGYISLGLKSQLRRRGFLDGPRGRTFSGLISLNRKPVAPPTGGVSKK